MTKGLEALHHPRVELASIDISAEGKQDIGYMPFYKTKQYTAIEKDLNALEIIKRVSHYDIDFLDYLLVNEGKISQREYDLLKEVLL